MKTFLSRPTDHGRALPEQLSLRIRKAARDCQDDAELIRTLHAIFQKVLRFDHIIFIAPENKHSRLYYIWPPCHGNEILLWPKSQENDEIMLNAYHNTMLRICEHGDYATTTISVLQKYMKEAYTENFSLMFLRRVIQERFFGLIGFVSFRKNAYDEDDAAVMFDLLEPLVYLWETRYPHSRNLELPRHDSEYFSLINLPGMQKSLSLIHKVSREDIPALILGETGTGKEGVANLIYRGSGRYMRPFIKINCGGIPPTLLESKLFGYQKGAFTGAFHDTPGCFEMADTGVLLLDELGELPLSAQTHLLRVLQEKVIERVGSSVETPVNVRIIAATNRNLSLMVKDGSFRRDLLYRLSIFPIYIPALRERPEDIPVLLNFFMLQQSRRMGFPEPPELAPSELARLIAYPWPGNIREMQNAVTRAMMLWNGKKNSAFVIDAGEDLFRNMFPPLDLTPPRAPDPPSSSSMRLEDVEREHITRVLAMTKGRVAGKGGAAEILDVNPSTLRARMQKLNIGKRR